MKRKKILLLHGWNWKNYTSCLPGETNPWNNRVEFLTQLKQAGFDVTMVTFPGFCGAPEPHKEWRLSEYLALVERHVQKEQPDAVLGYSFGGAVALGWSEAYQNALPIILVSPAILRKYAVKSGVLARVAKKLPGFVVEIFRDWYLKYYVKNPFYTYGSSFLRKTYRNIIGLDLTDILNRSEKKDLLLVYGSDDTATPVTSILQTLSPNSLLHNKIVIIKGGGHDIANSHTDELVGAIRSFLQ